jgi:1,2-dihydroxy-3-keto-5-methylthiopentene dioxygenase
MKAFWLDDGSAIPASALAAEDIVYMHIDTDPHEYRKPVDDVKAMRGYVQEDIVELSPSTPNLDTICAKFVDEHTHDDDEVRFVLEGEGIFDIRSRDDRYMRVQVEKGDLIVVPKDRNHRFMLTERKAIRCVRLFKDAAGWVPHYRGRA